MKIRDRIEARPAWATLALLGSLACSFTGHAHAADEPEVELPPEVNAVLGAPAHPTVDARASDARRLALAEPPSSFDALATSSVVTLAAGGALALLGGLLASIGSDERVCGLAGCVVRASDDADDRQSAGFRLIGAGVGAGLAGVAGLGASYLLPLERGESRDAPGQLIAGVAVSAVGASLVGVSIAGALQERVYADDAPTAALAVSGALAVGTGVLLSSTRSSGGGGGATPALVPSVSVGLGSARAEWRF